MVVVVVEEEVAVAIRWLAVWNCVCVHAFALQSNKSFDLSSVFAHAQVNVPSVLLLAKLPICALALQERPASDHIHGLNFKTA